MPETLPSKPAASPSQRPSNYALPLLLLLAICISLTVAFSEPGVSPWLPPCLFHSLTGLHCPGCGNTRALHALLHGHLADSLGYNCLLLPYALLIVVLLLKPRLSGKPCVIYTTLAVTLLFFLLRNLPWYPFTLLAP